MRISRRPSTVKNYEGWLMKFVEWLEQQSRGRPVTVTSHTVSDYLDVTKRYKTAESRQRVGAQIVLFVNRYLVERVHLIKGLGFDVKYDNVNMPEEYVDKIDTWLRGKLTEIKDKVADHTLKREVSKLLGKY